jgi:ATP/maltotriose-dependent transcriptional regulator MalT
MPDHNPFVYQVPVQPADFVGRQRARGLIFDQLRSSGRANVAVHGPLGIGKTSLLNYVSSPEIAQQQGLDPKTYLMCPIDCQSLGDFTPDHFWRRLLRSVSRSVNDDLNAAIDAVLAEGTVGFEDIQDFLDELNWHDRVLVVLLDEFEWIVRTNTEVAEQTTRHFLGMLSSLGRRTPRTFAMLVATERPLTALGNDLDVWRGSPFPSVFVNHELGPFTANEADDLLDRALAKTSITFSDAERQLIYQESGGHPAMLQAAAAAVYDAKREGASEDRLPAAVEQALTATRANGAGAMSGGQRFQVDDQRGLVWVHGRRVDGLTNKEFSLLKFLYENAGRVCPKEEIWHAVWPEYEEGMEDYPIQKLVSRLRSKIEPNPSRPQHIVTAWGRGYKFVE